MVHLLFPSRRVCGLHVLPHVPDASPGDKSADLALHRPLLPLPVLLPPVDHEKRPVAEALPADVAGEVRPRVLGHEVVIQASLKRKRTVNNSKKYYSMFKEKLILPSWSA